MRPFYRFVHKGLILFFCVALMAPISAGAGEYIEVSKDFTLFTSKNMQGYLKPLFTSVEESFNSNFFTTADYKEEWSIALDISVNGMFIPSSNRTYDAEMPDLYGQTDIVDVAQLRDGSTNRNNVPGMIKQPTIYGGMSYPVFSAPQNHLDPDSLYKSVAFVEGNDISFMSGIPAFQLMMGFPTRTQLRIRSWGVPNVQDETLFYFAFNINQQIDHFFDMFGEDKSLALALNFGYHMMNRGKGLSMNSLSFGAHFSKTWESGIFAYAAAQYENVGGEFKAIRTNFNPDDVANSPYKEIRDGDPLEFDIEGLNSYRILGGLGYRYGILELHLDAGWAEQPIVSTGITFWIASWGGKKKEKEHIEQFEEIERIERVKKEEKRETK